MGKRQWGFSFQSKVTAHTSGNYPAELEISRRLWNSISVKAVGGRVQSNFVQLAISCLNEELAGGVVSHGSVFVLFPLCAMESLLCYVTSLLKISVSKSGYVVLPLFFSYLSAAAVSGASHGSAILDLLFEIFLHVFVIDSGIIFPLSILLLFSLALIGFHYNIS